MSSQYRLQNWVRWAAPLAALTLAGCALPTRLDRAPAPQRPLPGLQAATAPAPALPAIRPLAASRVASDGATTLEANTQLRRLYGYTGLSDEQLARVRRAEAALAANDAAGSLAISKALIDELARSIKKHQVARGESLWTISAQPDIYANPLLWPLIWQANRDTIKQPSLLRAGQTLKIRPNPTIGEVVDAVTYARQHSAAKINIGEIQEVGDDR